MKRDELKKCVCCGKGVMHDGNIMFYRVTLERFIVDLGAIKRQYGLELMIGHAGIAAAMGPDEDIAKSLGPSTAIVCDSCAMGSTPLACLHETIEDGKEHK